MEKEEVNVVIEKYYDIETIVAADCLKFMSVDYHTLKNVNLKKYKNVKLVNVNGWGVGQAHFLTNEGYLMLPWCYIVSMIPSNV